MVWLKTILKMKKTCFVPICLNTSERNPKKLFLSVPSDINRRLKWFEAINLLKNIKNVPKFKGLYCCEDHFDLEEDSDNFQYFKTMGTKIRLKPDRVPHKFITTTPSQILESILTDSARKRKAESISMVSSSSTSAANCFPSTPVKRRCLNFDATEQLSPSGTFQIEHVKNKISSRNRSVQVKPSMKNVSVMVTSNIFCKNVGLSPIIFKSGKKKVLSAISPTKKLFIEPHSPATSYMSAASTSSFSPESSPTTETSNAGSNETSSYKNLISKEMVRKNSIRLTKMKPKFYTGIPDTTFSNVVTMISEKEQIPTLNIIISLRKIKLNDTYERLSDDFGLSITTIQKIFVTSVPKIANSLQNLIFWPDSQKIKCLLPIPFRTRYSNVQSIIDCFETEIQKPSDPILQASTWSAYKNCNTLKCLISCTPNGFINYISKAYPGRISDKEIVLKSDFLTVLPSCDIMADRGFKHLSANFIAKGCNLIRPPSVTTGLKSTKEEVSEAKKIAALRIHIERVIRRIRVFKILEPHSVINHDLLILADSIIIIVCALCNLQDNLIQ